MRVVDLSVPGLGFRAHSGQTFKILASYDGICNVTKIYINDKLRGIADPFDMGQFVFQPFVGEENLFESITLGDSRHRRESVQGIVDVPPDAGGPVGGLGVDESSLGYNLTAGNRYITKDWALPAAGQFATYPADPVLSGRNPAQIFLPWKGNILSANVWFDNGLREGIVYPSTCTTPPFS